MQVDGWAQLPRTAPRLEDGALHVWRFQLDELAPARSRVGPTLLPATPSELLSPAESRRAARILPPVRRERWARAHALLRLLLGLYTDQDPREVELRASRHGKLRVITGSRGSRRGVPLSFNVSHSGPVALFAFTTCGEVGIDVELTGRNVNEIGVARRVLGEETAERLVGMGGAERRDEFLRAWVRHEAELKCQGTGFSPGRARARVSANWTSELDVGPQARAAVAAQRAPASLRYMQQAA